ncbi:uncharacterized protein K444DRAFT_607587 [Hyaloscypha bicolor E]|uniref:VOC domain-containing protein n=1 Tax=Hyaloscypha bicolor E TaxID=1095630 RepID=A0A2J6TT31_9HELO|nr:uncharacterized protein K444DRAFT_607587 [Hyaloscypha bicolor E]PMD66155.1 hypothetical protein K444DRAFT_607587 [Hyaloscypha bicolor E]
MPLAHVSLPVSSLSESTAFYTTLLAPLGYGIYLSLEETVGMGPKYGAPDFWLHHCPKEKEGEKEGVSKTHICFSASSQKQVKAFYEAGLKAGGKDNGKPGERNYTKGYYAAYVLDLDGNNVECLYYQPLWLTAMQYAPSILGAAAVGAVAWWGGNAGWGL